MEQHEIDAEMETAGTAQREIDALTHEGRQYLASGMIDQLKLVNEQLKLRGADELPVPKVKPAQTRQSTDAATRRKATTK